ncbi:hypothetical protein CE91St67_09470 [Methanobrevibacter smithii]|nr:hypothetical protein CE91St67_09470 [Methanobrevibacter smithii]
MPSAITVSLLTSSLADTKLIVTINNINRQKIKNVFLPNLLIFSPPLPVNYFKIIAIFYYNYYNCK